MRLILAIRKKAHYGWAIFGLSFINLTVEGGIKNSEPVFFVALLDTFGAGAAATAALFSVAGLVGAFSAPFLGRFLDNAGPKVMFSLAGFVILSGWLASSLATDLWQLFILYSVIEAIGQTSISSFSNTAVLAPWFPNTTGRILGLADSGNPTGQLIFTPLASVLVASFGWRVSYQIFGIIFFLLVTPANFLFQRTYKPFQSRAESPTNSTIIDTNVPDMKVRIPEDFSDPLTLSIKDMLALWQVWLLVITRLLGGVGNQIIRLHLVAFFLISGYSPLEAGSVIGVTGLLNMVGRPVTGALSDRFGREVSYTVTMLMFISSIILVLLFGGGERLWPLVIYVGLAGLSEGTMGLIVGAKATDMFPPNILGSAMGLVEIGRGIGIAVGPVLGGLLFDISGNYTLAFTISIIFTLLSICSIWFLRIGSVLSKSSP